ncbi:MULTISPECIES: protein-L-isoaspartate O-methyltransferase [unclassified Wenzhouxiangella]|uniref:protein-L-isoaspartate O-methyltransferase family protein n=1 Tax=unclassified Wenzhouxiangella TaxID=2613841 RepID=UPI000E32C099|nr:MULTISPECIES: protein-L-isoaspartate O-methyltransferase [unclassified Wenzhouxiangella]RFF28538.1 protein-L-isoaspartate O-methyltransferase [Wenzhouxiangella sp. 15181]RFP70057.1 protein-L-isoaspartate O-methyltransferase [Wenzhouxiangella sp. 15190]
MSLNLEQARSNMVEQQVRTWEVLDPLVLEALREVPREDFAPSDYRRMAFSDLRIPLPHDQFMMKPIEEGRMLQSLEIQPGQRVLEIGTGSGFTAACLAYMGASVLSIDIFEELTERARRRFKRLAIDGIEVRQADALGDFDPGETFDAVAVTGSAAEVPERFRQWVKPGGRLFAVRGFSPVMEAISMTRSEHDHWQVDSLFDTDLPRLVGAEDRPQFEF